MSVHTCSSWAGRTPAAWAPSSWWRPCCLCDVFPGRPRWPTLVSAGWPGSAALPASPHRSSLWCWWSVGRGPRIKKWIWWIYWELCSVQSRTTGNLYKYIHLTWQEVLNRQYFNIISIWWYESNYRLNILILGFKGCITVKRCHCLC